MSDQNRHHPRDLQRPTEHERAEIAVAPWPGRGIARTTYGKTGQQIPFFMLPYVGSGSTLRGFTSHRFRDQNSLTLQAEWRIMVNRFMETAVFYDTGKVAARRADLDLDGLKSDYGFGFRLHGPFATPVRIEIARSPEGLRLIFAGDAIF